MRFQALDRGNGSTKYQGFLELTKEDCQLLHKAGLRLPTSHTDVQSTYCYAFLQFPDDNMPLQVVRLLQEVCDHVKKNEPNEIPGKNHHKTAVEPAIPCTPPPTEAFAPSKVPSLTLSPPEQQRKRQASKKHMMKPTRPPKRAKHQRQRRSFSDDSAFWLQFNDDHDGDLEFADVQEVLEPIYDVLKSTSTSFQTLLHQLRALITSDEDDDCIPELEYHGVDPDEDNVYTNENHRSYIQTRQQTKLQQLSTSWWLWGN